MFTHSTLKINIEELEQALLDKAKLIVVIVEYTDSTLIQVVREDTDYEQFSIELE